MLDETYDVVLCNPGEALTNTIVLSGIDVVVPVEADLDGDPDQDDEVRLRSLDGRVERVLLASDADAVEDQQSSRFIYRFRDVPPGIYALSVRISDDDWAPLMTGIVITTKDATWHGKPLATALGAFSRPEKQPTHQEDTPAPGGHEESACGG